MMEPLAKAIPWPAIAASISRLASLNELPSTSSGRSNPADANQGPDSRPSTRACLGFRSVIPKGQPALGPDCRPDRNPRRIADGKPGPAAGAQADCEIDAVRFEIGGRLGSSPMGSQPLNYLLDDDQKSGTRAKTGFPPCIHAGTVQFDTPSMPLGHQVPRIDIHADTNGAMKDAEVRLEMYGEWTGQAVDV